MEVRIISFLFLKNHNLIWNSEDQKKIIENLSATTTTTKDEPNKVLEAEKVPSKPIITAEDEMKEIKLKKSIIPPDSEKKINPKKEQNFQTFGLDEGHG